MPFSDFNLPYSVIGVLQQHNIRKPYPIQEEAIPAALAGKDILGIAQTGSGKTLSYVLPVLTRLNDFPESRARHPQVLILVPTRELAIQVLEVFKLFIDPNRNQYKTITAFGGTSLNPQMMAMTETKILIATPGRLLDLTGSNALRLSGLQLLVLDEADKMLNSGFKKEVDQILKLVPEKSQKLLFSATLSPEVQNIKQLFLKEPLVIQISKKKEKLNLIKQSAYLVTEERKGPFLRYLIKSNKLEQVLVFTSSIKEADKVADKLNKNGVQAASIHGKKSQHGRNQALDGFKEGAIKVLVTTDLLSRGIDIEALPHVINYELPRSPKDFIHRVGRTGRAENEGQAISLITEVDKHHFEIIQKKMQTKVDLLTTEEINLHGY